MKMKVRTKSQWLPIALFLLCLTGYLSSVASRPAAATDDAGFVSTSTRAGRLLVFDDVWETIYERYYDPALGGIDWEASRNAYRPAAAEAKGTHDFYELLRRMIAPLKDAHTRVFSPEEKFDWWSPRFITIGVIVREVEGRPTVVHVEPKSMADRGGLRAGDVVISVDDKSAQEIIARRMKSSKLSESARSRATRALFEGEAGTNLTLKWKNRQGRIKSTLVQRYWSKRTLGFRSQSQDGIAIISLDAFTQTIAADFLKQLPAMLNGSHAIILDLRGNGGGDAEAMANIASAFLDRGVNLGKFADRSGASFELLATPRFAQLYSAVPPGKLPMVVLTSELTSSAAEILASTLQHRGRARIVGTSTCGCVLAIRNRHTLPDGGVLDVSEFDYRTAQGIRLEGLGIKPDEVSTLTRSDLYARRDVALQRAKAYLLRNGK